jgi:transcriptional regulator with XRE-family HTH domain
MLEQKVLEKIGERLKILRIRKSYTSYEHFAIEHDLSRMHYWNIEKGKANITIKTLVKILAIHQISIEDFFAIDISNQ